MYKNLNHALLLFKTWTYDDQRLIGGLAKEQILCNKALIKITYHCMLYEVSLDNGQTEVFEDLEKLFFLKVV